MSRLYMYRIKSFLRDFITLFWTVAFPLLLGTFFFLAFGSITSRLEEFEAIPVAVVNEDADAPLALLVTQLSEGDAPTLAPVDAGRDAAMKLLDDGDVAAVLEIGETPVLTVNEDGIRQSVLKGILDRYLQVEATVTAIARENPEAVPAALDRLTETDALTTPVEGLAGNSDYMVQYFYALIAMACLFGGFFGINSVLFAQPGQSALGIRRSASPTRRSVLLAGDFLASLTVIFAGVLLLLAYLRGVLGIDLGGPWWATLLLCLTGCAGGVMLGVVVAAVLPVRAVVKEGLFIGISLVLSFFGGLMYYDMRFVVEEHAPFFNKINPAALVVDALYALDAYGVGARFWTNIGCLAALTAVLGTAAILCLRRKPHASV